MTMRTTITITMMITMIDDEPRVPSCAAGSAEAKRTPPRRGSGSPGGKPSTRAAREEEGEQPAKSLPEGAGADARGAAGDGEISGGLVGPDERVAVDVVH
jgi:hypothetical protein